MVHNFVCRVIPVFDNGNNVDPVGYRFEILYMPGLVLTDGDEYRTFDKCVESLSKYLIRLNRRNGLNPLIVDFGDL